MKRIILGFIAALACASVQGATATGDVAIDFSPLGNSDPYTNANLTLIDTGYNVQIATNVLRPSNGGSGQFDARRIYWNGAMSAATTIRSKVEIGNAGSGDEIIAYLIQNGGSGYALRINQTSVGIHTVTGVAGSPTFSGLISGTLGTAASGDVVTLELALSTNTLTVYLNGVAVSGSGPGGLLAVVDATYTTGLAPGLGFNAQNSSASTIRSWAGDGPTAGGGGGSGIVIKRRRR